jgi:acetoin utilization protein AcuB
MSKPIPSISKYMTTTPRTVSGSVTLAAAGRLMQEHDIRHLPVVDDGQLLGIITDRDIKYVSSFGFVQPESVPLRGAMSEKPYSVAPETPMDEVVATMAENKYGAAVVVQNGHVVGVFTTVDACRALSELLGTRLRK